MLIEREAFVEWDLNGCYSPKNRYNEIKDEQNWRQFTMQKAEYKACATDVFSAEKNGVEYYIFAEDFTPKLCDFASEIQKALDGRMDMIRTYVESNSDYKEAFGKLDGEQRKKLLLHPQVYIFSDGGTITWLGSKYVTDKMISINFFGAVDELGTVEILDI